MGFETTVPLGPWPEDKSEDKRRETEKRILSRLEEKREGSPVAQFILGLSSEER